MDRERIAEAFRAKRGLLRFCRASIASVFLAETIDTALSVHILLFSSEKRMAVRANINANFFLRRAGFECVAANARYSCVSVISGMDSVFHN